MRDALTPRLVSTLRPAAGKVREVWFDEHRDAPRGFALRVTAAGSRSYYLLATVRGSGQRWIRIGDAAAITLEAARVAATMRAGEIAAGRNPNAEGRAQKAASRAARLAVASDANEWTVDQLLGAYVAARTASLSSRTMHVYTHSTNRLLETGLAGLRARDVVRSDVRSAVAAIAKRGPGAAWTALAFMRAAFRWALDEELVVVMADGKRVARPRVDRDPTRRIEHDFPAVKKACAPRTRVLSDAELRAWWPATATLSVGEQAFVRLVLLCGTRRGETLAARWDDMELEGDAPTWSIPAEVRKGRVEQRRPLDVPLSPLAVDVLQALRDARPRADHLFRGASIQASTVGDRLKIATDIHDVTIHDLRRSCASGLQRIGAPPHVISVVLGHAREAGAVATDAHYTHDRRLSEHRLWLERWARHVEALLGLQRPADVVPIRA
jgi:integrase